MNKPLLRKVAAAIKAHPKRFRMDEWIETRDGVAPCGTAACIAGHAVILSIKNANKRIRKSWKTLGAFAVNSYTAHGPECQIRSKAESALDLTYSEAQRLFFLDNWPIEFAPISGEGRSKLAKRAVARIKHFIETEGIE